MLVTQDGFRVKTIIILMIVVFIGAEDVAAQTMNLWPDGPPDGIRLHDREEEVMDRTGEDQRSNRIYSYVTVPTLTVIRAPKATGAAILVFPGGGYRDVWIDKEGYQIAQWLHTLGITAVVVKYRTRLWEMPDDLWPKVKAMTLADAERAMRLTRLHATEWGIDPDRIGALGFSSGGDLAIRLTESGDEGIAEAADPAERHSSRPNFVGLVYSSIPDSIHVSSNHVPTFIVNASDDRGTPAQGSVRMYSALLEAGIQAELHIFRAGGHGFGLGLQGGPVRNWMGLFEDWVIDLNLLRAKP
jgi:acetyl esterase/lipase